MTTESYQGLRETDDGGCGFAAIAGLEIRPNNCATNDPCALCGARTDPAIGPELFKQGTWAVVCHDCGGQRAPGLMVQLSDMQDEFDQKMGTGICTECGQSLGHGVGVCMHC